MSYTCLPIQVRGRALLLTGTDPLLSGGSSFFHLHTFKDASVL